MYVKGPGFFRIVGETLAIPESARTPLNPICKYSPLEYFKL
jgi:hypothetical protein